MPDLVTHLGVAYFLKKPKAWSSFRIPFYLGAILPDILSRPLYIIHPPAYFFIYSIHTPLVVALICLILAEFFEERIRSGVRLNLLLGAGTHFTLDILQRHVTASYYWFFPFSFKTFHKGLFWPDDSVRLVPAWIVLIAVVEIVIYTKKRIKGKEAHGL